MAYIFSSIPYFRALARREYTTAFTSGHGEYLPVVAHGVRCVRGSSLFFQCMMTEKWAGAAYLLPIEALVTKPVELPRKASGIGYLVSHDALSADEIRRDGSSAVDRTHIQPWDCFSADFGICELDFVKRGRVTVLPGKIDGRYRFTIDFTNTDLADDLEQHKHLHVCELDNGLICAVPNNRLLWHDPAFWETTTERPDFKALGGEFRAE